MARAGPHPRPQRGTAADLQPLISTPSTPGPGRPLPAAGLTRKQGATVIDVTQDQSWPLPACNYLCLGDRAVIGYGMAADVLRRLRDAGVTVTAVDGDELVKGRGGPRWMSRPVYRAPQPATTARRTPGDQLS
ncbi:arginine deiminase family protein [Streptomyces sp. NPDC058326]|uniref:arginine deiminase family protein n=1 Tax=Streptomyces sp. NPDC058326 TaxID=3346447 RepID=UPI0036EDCD8C